ncbi:hypothetical protein F4861DRAFT_544393 [Xylaria intraflava]|nr:hypothetical protein F4861DRAFT_544393 [Xylaria intraflava]
MDILVLIEVNEANAGDNSIPPVEIPPHDIVRVGRALHLLQEAELSLGRAIADEYSIMATSSDSARLANLETHNQALLRAFLYGMELLTNHIRGEPFDEELHRRTLSYIVPPAEEASATLGALVRAIMRLDHNLDEPLPDGEKVWGAVYQQDPRKFLRLSSAPWNPRGGCARAAAQNTNAPPFFSVPGGRAARRDKNPAPPISAGLPHTLGAVFAPRPPSDAPPAVSGDHDVAPVEDAPVGDAPADDVPLVDAPVEDDGETKALKAFLAREQVVIEDEDSADDLIMTDVAPAQISVAIRPRSSAPTYRSTDIERFEPLPADESDLLPLRLPREVLLPDEPEDSDDERAVRLDRRSLDDPPRLSTAEIDELCDELVPGKRAPPAAVAVGGVVSGNAPSSATKPRVAKPSRVVKPGQVPVTPPSSRPKVTYSGGRPPSAQRLAYSASQKKKKTRRPNAMTPSVRRRLSFDPPSGPTA